MVMNEGSSRVPWWADRRVRLAVLLACLGLLVLYLLVGRAGVLGFGADNGKSSAGGAWTEGCPARGAPQVARVAPRYVAELRAEVRGAMRGRHGRLYQLGTVSSEVAWSDNSPQPGATLLPEIALVPGAYEMRWWAPNRDDIVADVFIFADASQARAFFNRASSPRCRPDGAQTPASSPPGARDLVWLNPDGFAQEDVYLVRGQYVYRVGDVRPDQRTTRNSKEERAAFSIINGLALQQLRRSLTGTAGPSSTRPGHSGRRPSLGGQRPRDADARSTRV
jgi:hypothetical protein